MAKTKTETEEAMLTEEEKEQAEKAKKKAAERAAKKAAEREIYFQNVDLLKQKEELDRKLAELKDASIVTKIGKQKENDFKKITDLMIDMFVKYAKNRVQFMVLNQELIDKLSEFDPDSKEKLETKIKEFNETWRCDIVVK
ncbi:MAG: hypothetical protein KBS54_00570 [Synergistaceae bacterium]|nr:hypothetical protein [Candidatus Equadaptatus faecalis]